MDSWLVLESSATRWGTSYWNPGGLLSDADNTDDFHVVRMATDSSVDPDDGNYYFHIWRDGTYLGKGRDWMPWHDSPTEFVNRLMIGDLSGATAGTFEIDYLRFTDGAFAPVPEPSTFVLATGVLGLLAYAWRRRK